MGQFKKFTRKFSHVLIKTTLGTILVQANGFSGEAIETGKIIYGEDDRIEYYQVDEKWQKLADATAAMISKNNFQTRKNDSALTIYDLFAQSLEDSFTRVCSDEKFAQQLSAGNCSGFLVAPNVLVTAGHCVFNQARCDSYFWVFDYNLSQEGDTNAPTSYDEKQVYSCKRIINYKYARGIMDDYAVLELDRVVDDRTPLKVRTNGSIKVGDAITVIGHPSGLPSKIAGGANVRNIEPNQYFTANLDTFGGNSGSAVFNDETMEVEGILVRGDTDYKVDYERGCRVVNVCKDDECRGEDVTKITEINELVYRDQMLAAVKAEDLKSIRKILADGFSLTMPIEDVDTSVIISAKEGKLDSFKLLIERKANINDVSPRGMSASKAIMLNGQVELLEHLLIDQGFSHKAILIDGKNLAEYSLQNFDVMGLTSLAKAGYGLENYLAESLIAKSLLDPKKAVAIINADIDLSQASYLDQLVVEATDSETIASIIKRRDQSDNLNKAFEAKNDQLAAKLIKHGQSFQAAAAKVAISNGMNESIQAMLNQGLNPSTIIDGQGLAEIAVINNNFKLADNLLKRGADITPFTKAELGLKLINSEIELKNATYATEIARLTQVDQLVAAIITKKDLLALLLDAVINTKDDQLASKLVNNGQKFEAWLATDVIENGLNQTLKALVENGLNVNVLEYKQGRPLSYTAIASNNLEALAYLLEQGIDLKQRDFNNTKIIRFAKDQNNKEAVKMIRKEKRKRLLNRVTKK
jgi:V8-like Glu-specific endopeptidase/ankyrin repeat protein